MDKKTILIVEDSPINRKILKRILEAKGYDTLEAENGQEALDLLQHGPQTVSLMLLDLTMPVMNGYQLLARMEENGLLALIPVIVTTGSECGNAEIRSLECGASDFITKPYNPEIVCHRIESILRRYDNAALISQLEIDHLTGVYTREAFYRRAKIILDAHPEEHYHIVCSDIENFKVINSKYGISVGDELLRCVAAHTAAYVGQDGVCGRLGADTFAMLVKRGTPYDQEEIGRHLSHAFWNAPVKSFVMQFGIYPIDDRSSSVSAMCDCAQIALSTIKHKYGVFYAVYNDSMRQKILRDHQLTNYMESALAEKQFVVYLQPKHEAATGYISGAEALVRWFHPELGFIPPGEFIPLFERNGFIAKLDRYVWETVCQLLQGWMKAGRPLIPISVNASRADFDSDELPYTIAALVDSYGVPRKMIHLEVTESAYTDNPQQIVSAVSTLRSMGFLIEMDDFGSGYSSLNMLSELPIDILKLDMRFMQKGKDMLPDSKRSILSFIVSLSKWLQLPTVAEGVETKDELELLKAMGCNYIQGFYFAKPMPIPDFEQYLSEQEALRLAHEAETQPEETPPAQPPQPQSLPRVLVVEDVECNRQLLVELLEPYYQVSAACDGAQAYQLIQEQGDQLSCVLLDLLMPVMDGFELLDKLRNDGYLDKVPVIITSEAGSNSELRALRLGADSFVSKPYEAEILLHHVKKAVNEREFRKLRKLQEQAKQTAKSTCG